MGTVQTVRIDLKEANKIDLPSIPSDCKHNAHMFYIKLRDIQERTDFISYMRQHEVCCVFHYIPLHSAPAGLKYGRFSGEDRYTTRESERLVRLPMYYGLKEADVDYIISTIKAYFELK